MATKNWGVKMNRKVEKENGGKVFEPAHKALLLYEEIANSYSCMSDTLECINKQKLLCGAFI